MNKISIRLVLINLFLVAMAAIYLPIGLWAFVAPIQDALELNLPSLYEQVGFSILSPIGFSEFAGIYGGLNFCIGVFCLVGIFVRAWAKFMISFITFLVAGIAFGRLFFLLLGTQAGLPIIVNSFLKFEIIVFFLGLLMLKFLKDLDDTTN